MSEQVAKRLTGSGRFRAALNKTLQEAMKDPLFRQAGQQRPKEKEARRIATASRSPAGSRFGRGKHIPNHLGCPASTRSTRNQ